MSVREQLVTGTRRWVRALAYGTASDRAGAYVSLGIFGGLPCLGLIAFDGPRWVLALLALANLLVLLGLCRLVQFSTSSIEVRDGRVSVALAVVGYRAQVAPEDCAVVDTHASMRARFRLLVMPDGMTFRLGSGQLDRLLAAGVPLAVESADYDVDALLDPRTDWRVFGRPATTDVVRQLPPINETVYDVLGPRSASSWWPGFDSIWVGSVAAIFGARLQNAWVASLVQPRIGAKLLATLLWLAPLVAIFMPFSLFSVLQEDAESIGLFVCTWWFLLFFVVGAGSLSTSAESLEMAFGRYALWHAGPARPR